MGDVTPTEPRKMALLLRKSVVFRDFSEDALCEIARSARVRRYRRGEIIMCKGEAGDRMLVVVTGRVRISATSPKGSELTISVVHPGEVVGEMSVLDGRERSADATAITDTEGIEVGRPALMQFLERQPKLALKLIAVLCDKLRKTTELAEDAVFLNLAARLYRKLTSLADENGRTDAGAVLIEHRLSQEELAFSIGATRESVNKQLRAWEETGLVEVGRGWIRVRDFAALTAQVEDACGLSLSGDADS